MSRMVSTSKMRPFGQRWRLQPSWICFSSTIPKSSFPTVLSFLTSFQTHKCAIKEKHHIFFLFFLSHGTGTVLVAATCTQTNSTNFGLQSQVLLYLGLKTMNINIQNQPHKTALLLWFWSIKSRRLATRCGPLLLFQGTGGPRCWLGRRRAAASPGRPRPPRRCARWGRRRLTDFLRNRFWFKEQVEQQQQQQQQ